MTRSFLAVCATAFAAVAGLTACTGSTAKAPTAKAPTAMELAIRLERIGQCETPKPSDLVAHSVECAEFSDASRAGQTGPIVTAFRTREALLRKIQQTTLALCRYPDRDTLEFVGGRTWLVVGADNPYLVARELKGRLVPPKPCPRTQSA